MVAAPTVLLQHLPFAGYDIPSLDPLSTPPTSPALSALRVDLDDSSADLSSTTLSTQPAAQPAMTTKTSLSALSSFFRERLETIGDATSTNWPEWSKLASALAGAILGDHTAYKKLDGTTKKSTAADDANAVVEENGTWSLLAFIFKEIVEQYGGDAHALWAALVRAYDETTSGPEATALLIELTHSTYDPETTSPSSLAATLRLKQQRVNAAFKREAERAVKNDPSLASDPHVQAALLSSFNSLMLKALLLSLLPAKVTQLIEDVDRDGTFDNIVTRAERMWLDKRQRCNTNSLAALRVKTRRSAVRPATAQPAAVAPTTSNPTPAAARIPRSTNGQNKKRKQPQQKVAATMFDGYERWRGGTRSNGNGILLFRTPADSCFRCFGKGHFARDCTLDDQGRARSRVRELGKDGIKVPVDDALALFVVNDEYPSPPADDSEATNEARYVGAVSSTGFHVDESLPRNYFVTCDPNLPADTSAVPISATPNLDPLAALAVASPDSLAPPPLASLVLPKSLPSDYIVDSGANRSYTTRLDHLRNFQAFEKPVQVGGAFGLGGWAYGVGSLVFSLSPQPFSIANVLYVPLLGVNLISQTALMIAGVRFTNTRSRLDARGEDGALLFSLPVKPTLRIRASPVLPSSPSPPPPSAPSLDPAVAASDRKAAFSVQTLRANAFVWHGRTGHSSYHRVGLMYGGLSTGMEVDGSIAKKERLPCSFCAMGKMTRKTVEREALQRASRPLERLAADVWGPCAIASRKGEQYLVGIIDDASRYMWVQPMRQKSESGAIIAARMRREERSKGAKVVALRTDKGGEFVNKVFDSHLSAEGIRHETSVAGKHEQNGLIERQWRSVFEMVRCWLAQSGLPLSFWDLAARAAVFVKNLLPTSANANSISPHEAYNGSRPDVSILRVWGCVVYVRVEKTRTKVHPRGVRGQFVGYLEDTKGWLVWLPGEGKLVETWDAVFFEEEFGKERSDREEQELERWLAQLDWDDEEVDDTREEEGQRRESPLQEDNAIPAPRSPTSTTPLPAQTAADDSPAPRTTPSPPPTPPRQTPLPSPPAPRPPPPRPSRGPPTRHSSRLAQEAPSHYVPLQGAPEVPVAAPPALATDPTALPLSAFLTSASPSRNPLDMPNRALLALATLDPSLDADPSTQILAESELEAPAAFAAGPAWNGSLDQPSFRQAMAGPDAEQWRLAMETELASFRALETWDEELVELPEGRRALPVKWVLVVKRDAEGRVVKYKARLVARGDRQVEGLDFDETHSSTVRLTTVRLLLALLAHDPSLRLLQFDVSSAYLHGELDRDIFLQQPEGFADPSRPRLVRRLRKALYGLRQGGREWQRVFRAALEQLGFKRSDADHGLYTRRSEGGRSFVAAHVDDGLVIGSEEDLSGIVKALDGKFEGGVRETTGGLFLGMKVQRGSDGSVSIDQAHYARLVLDRFFPSGLSPVSTPVDSAAPVPTAATEEERLDCPYRELLGALVYLVTCTRPDLAYAVAVASRFAACPAERHWRYLQRICRYLSSTLSLDLIYRRPPSPSPLSASLLTGWSDADHAGDRDTRRSVSGFTFTFGADPLSATAISWCSRRQKSVTISSTEAEYVAMSEAAREGIWLRQLLADLSLSPSSPTLLRGDNSGALILASHPSPHSRTKHIGVHHHFTREKVEEGVIKLKWVPTAQMVADVMTKGLGTAKHLLFRGMCGLADVRSEGGCRTEEGMEQGSAPVSTSAGDRSGG